MKLWSFTNRFIEERQILNNVSSATLTWYRYSLKAFQPVLEAEYEATGFKAAVIQRIGELQQQGRGNKAVSVNTYLRCLKAFMAWAYENQIVKEPFNKQCGICVLSSDSKAFVDSTNRRLVWLQFLFA